MTSEGADHLCVLVHGLWGNPSHLSYLSDTLSEANPSLHVLVAKSNANSFTYDGIELGGERTAHEIEQKIQELEDGGHHITKLSVVGYSLGGLVARYAIGLLYSNGLFDKVKPMNFTTFASPHLGVRTPSTGPHSYLWNVLGARTLSASGRQLFTVDDFRDTGRPLLAVMADASSIFIRALSLFKHRSLYCNIINDRSVVYYTAGINSRDPYIDLDAVDLQPLPGYDGVILRPDEPVRRKSRKPMGVFERLRMSAYNTLTTIPIAALLVVLVPIGSALFLLNSAYQTIRSAQRVKLHEAGQGGFGIERYRIPLVEDARSGMSRVYERLNTTQEEEFLPDSPAEDDDASKDENPLIRVKSQDRFPTLAITQDQFDMIEALDDVGFVKYPVHISKVRHSHAAIIVRMRSRKGFSEGKVVVRHWIEKFEL